MTTSRLRFDLEQFQHRVIQDALTEALADYWIRRAEALLAARPRPGDFNRGATLSELAERSRRLTEAAAACRAAAQLAPLQTGDLDDEIIRAMRDVA